MKDVTLRLYENGRHEMFHEVNKDEVFKDLISWLDAHNNEKDNPKLFVVWDYLFYRNTGNKFLNLLYLIKINLIL